MRGKKYYWTLAILAALFVAVIVADVVGFIGLFTGGKDEADVPVVVEQPAAADDPAVVEDPAAAEDPVTVPELDVPQEPAGEQGSETDGFSDLLTELGMSPASSPASDPTNAR